ncbi:thiol reductant ABC exporter subunit CydC [Devosia sp.]|uniref:thiol reductant ABC exporter subunit CydC n=1 Tax=Devosia sp. TaxID=1871048 RepID=UPI003A93B3ED
MKAILSFAPLFSRVRGALAIALILSLTTLAMGIALLGVSGWFLTAAALTTAGAAFNLFGPSAAVRGLSFARILSRYGEKLTGHDTTLRLLSDLRRWLFAKLFPIVPSKDLSRADLVSRLVGDVDALDTVFLMALGPIATALLTVLAMSIGLGVLLPGAALPYAAASLIAIVGVPLTLIALSRQAGNEAVSAASALRQALLDGLDGHQDLVLLGATSRTINAADAAADRLAKAKTRLGLLGALAGGATQFFAGVAMVSVLVAGLSALPSGAIDGPLLAGLVLAVVASFEASAMLVRSTTRLTSAAAAAERIEAILAAPSQLIEAAEPVAAGDTADVTFDNVLYGYSADRPVLDALSFAVPAGTCVALVGPSGAGKSTIAQLLVRLADPQQGEIRIGGVPIQNMRLDTLREQVTLMTQDAPVFNDSVRANLRIGNPDADDAALHAVLRRVGLDEVIAALPQGLNTILGEAGRTLSAGQARRLCLARALLSPARVLVLDEPTAGLDPEAEAAFLTDLRDIAAGRTVVLITHTTLPANSMDRTLTLRAGRLSEAIA